MPKMVLNKKQRRFCAEYVKDLNATQAALRAGYSPRTARSIGQENLTKPAIQAEISRKEDEIAAKTGITLERTLKELEMIAYFDIRNLYDSEGNLIDVHLLNDDAAHVVSGVDVTLYRRAADGDEGAERQFLRKLKTWDKMKALEMLARHQGAFKKDNEQQRPVVLVPDGRVSKGD